MTVLTDYIDAWVAGDAERSTFDGATVARTGDGLIRPLREYQTTAPLYDWQGTWHSE